MLEATPLNYNCPQCGQLGHNVSGQVASGAAPHLRTNLIESEPSLPPLPSLPSAYESPWGCFSFAFVLLALGIAGLSVSAVVYFWGWVEGGDIFYDPSVVLGFHVAAIVAVLIVVITIIYKSNEAKYRRDSIAADLQQRAAVEHQREELRAAAHRRKEAALEVWNELYYCPVNNIVFLPPKRPGEPTLYARAAEREEFILSLMLSRGYQR
jgi:hypothetical protein